MYKSVLLTAHTCCCPSVLQAIDLHKRGKETKQAVYRRLIHTALDVDDIQEVTQDAVLNFSLVNVLNYACWWLLSV